MNITITRGLDVPVDGAPEAVIEPGAPVGTVALIGADYVGLEPRMRVQAGDRVGLGEPLFEHKRDPAVVFAAPGSGTVSAINRGARRVLKSVVIELDEDTAGGPAPSTPAGPALSVRETLLRSGLWTAFRTRPFDRIPRSDSEPCAVFVTAVDSRPLAADPRLVVAEAEQAFARGLDALQSLTDGPIHLCTGPGWTGPTGDPGRIRHAQFAGPHPAGLAGTHIHHLDPVGGERVAWHIGYQDVIAIGRLLGGEGGWHARVVALGGNGFERPRLVRTRLGASIADLTAGELRSVATGVRSPRVVSGSLLDGRQASGSEAWLGRFHTQVSAVAEPGPGRRLRWRRLFDGRFSFAGTFARRSRQSAPVPFDTDQNGRPTALVPIDAFERLIPLDVLTEPLLRSLLIGDTDQAQALGCLELGEEDLALCSFICPGKNDYGAVLRANLDQIEREG